MKRLKEVGLAVVTIGLGLLLIGCGGRGDGEGEVASPAGGAAMETRGDLETLSNEAAIHAQPHYQQLQILPSSYIQIDNNGIPARQSIQGSIKGIFSRYDGQVPLAYADYEIYKYEISYHIVNINTNLTANFSSFSLIAELPDGEYRLGISDPQSQDNILWEDEPILTGFKTFEIGKTYEYRFLLQEGSYTVLDKEYVTVGQIRYPAWKILEISKEGTLLSEEYRWVNPSYGTLRVQLTMSDGKDHSLMFLEAVLQESH